MSKWTQPGVLLLDKHSGVTSMKAVSQLKGKLKLHKVGHAGTLDPLATGLLICLLNGATRLAPYASAGQKRYTGIMSFGVESSTDDVDGSLSKRNVPPPALSVIRDMLTRFEGTIDQVPPQVSAVKVNGQKAYQRARKGLETELKSRSIRVDSFCLAPLESGDEKFLSFSEAEFCESYRYDVVCSPGTYIRSLARDLGDVLGCGAIVTTLRREKSFPFSVGDALPIEDVSLDSILSWEVLFPGIRKLACEEEIAQKIKTGNQSAVEYLTGRYAEDQEQLVMYTHEATNDPLGLLMKQGEEWKVAVNIC